MCYIIYDYSVSFQLMGPLTPTFKLFNVICKGFKKVYLLSGKDYIFFEDLFTKKNKYLNR